MTKKDTNPAPNSFRPAKAEEVYSPEFLEFRDKFKDRANSVMDWAIKNKVNLPKGVTLDNPKEGLFLLNLNLADETDRDEDGIIIITRDDVVGIAGQVGINPVAELKVSRVFPGEVQDSWKNRHLQFMTNGFVKIESSYEQEIDKGGIFIYAPLEPYSTTNAHMEDLRFEEQNLEDTLQALGVEV